jgi:hypothetical protein
MENEQNSQFGNQSTPTSLSKIETSADKEWSDLQRDLDTLGTQLAQLRQHTAALGETAVATLEAHYQDVKSRAMRFRQATEQQLDAARRSAWQQAGDAQGAFKDRSREAARQMWEKSEPLRQGAKDVGEGLGRAWSELRASFGKAAGRLNTQSPQPNGQTTPSTNNPHETT